MDIFKMLKETIKDKHVRIVFPEAEDERVIGAVVRLAREQLVEPVLIGSPDVIRQKAEANGFDLREIEIIDPSTYEDLALMVDEFVKSRRGKATADDAREALKNVNYFGTMLVQLGRADGLVSGAVYSTGDTVRPALQIIKTKPGTKIISGAFILIRGNDRYVFADCAITPEPDAEALAHIAVDSAETAKMFGIDPRVAMLSFSTKGSGFGEQVDKVREATRLAQELAPDILIDGEMQFDTAISADVAEKKDPDSEVAGRANVFVFPDLQSGNIAYKIAQRLGGFEAIGPVLQGMAKPISDLSRGSIEEDIYKLGIITANQVQQADVE